MKMCSAKYMVISQRGISPGVLSKIEGQTDAFTKGGIVTHRTTINSESVPMTIVSTFKEIVTASTDVLYFRSKTVYTIVAALSLLLRRRRIVAVLEIPTPLNQLYREIKGSSYNPVVKLGTLCVMKIFMPLVLYLFNIIVEMGPEDPRYYRKHKAKFVFTSNGISCEAYKKRMVNGKNGVFTILGAGYLSPWHGFDRVLQGIKQYVDEGHDDVFFRIVGDGPEYDNLIALVDSLSLTNYVSFQGRLDREAMNEFFDEADVAIGSIANHRKGMNFDTAIKSREYFARGIPFVVSTEDVEIPSDSPFLYFATNDDAPVDIKAVKNFYNDLKLEIPDYIERMREYARTQLNWDKKMAPVIRKIETVLEKACRAE